jgi:hypothetical protein
MVLIFYTGFGNFRRNNTYTSKEFVNLIFKTFPDKPTCSVNLMLSDAQIISMFKYTTQTKLISMPTFNKEDFTSKELLALVLYTGAEYVKGFVPRQIDPKQIDLKQIDLKQIDLKQIDLKQIAPRQIAPRQIAPRQIVPRQIVPRQIAPRQIVPRQIAPQEQVKNNKCCYMM